MPIAGADAVWDALQVCRNGIQLKFGVRVPTHPQGSPEKQLRAIYRRIQAASPPPTRDGRPWEYGIRVKDDTEDGQPLRVADGDDSWKRVAFTNEVDQRGFLSVSYPQPHIGDDGVTPVGVAYFEQYTLHWARQLPPGAWVAISFDRFWPPERDSADYIAQVEDGMLPAARGPDRAAQTP